MCSLRIFLTIFAILVSVSAAPFEAVLHPGRYGRFLQNISINGQGEFFGSRNNQNLTLDQLNQKDIEWAKKYGVLEKYEEYQASLTSFQKRFPQKLQSFMSRLPILLEHLNLIWNNTEQTLKAQRESEAMFRESMPLEYYTLYTIIAGSYTAEQKQLRNNGPFLIPL